MKKTIAPLLLFLVVATIATIAFFYMQNQKEAAMVEADKQATLNAPVPIAIVTGLIGSEKRDFFEDKDVQRILKDKYQMQVAFETVGSRRIATTGGANGTLDNYSFAFPAGVPAAESIKNKYAVKSSYRVFFTPMTIASFKPVVQVLQNNGIVHKEADHYAVLDMKKLLELMSTKTRWQDLPNNQGFDIKRQILINSTDIRSSNSAAMYLSLASYLANNDSIITSKAQAQDVIPKVLPLFANQGFAAGSSATPFEDYTVKGMGHSPMVMIYESQYLYMASMQDSGAISDDMVLLYPEPAIFTQHILLAMDENGEKLGNALENDDELQALAIKHGYRSNNPAFNEAFTQNLEAHHLDNVPSQFKEVIDTPNYSILEYMITAIEAQLAQ